MKKALQERIEKFIAVKSESSGGWAPATYDELWELHAILMDIVAAKYEEDPDGDLPIEATLINRCKTYGFHYAPLPYLHDKDVSLKEINDVLRLAGMNLSMAQNDVESTLKQLDWYVRDNEQSEET